MRYPNSIYAIVHTIARSFFDLYGSWEVIGRGNIPAAGPVIIAPNHISYLDPPLVGAAVPRPCSFMARHDLWRHPVLNWLLPYLEAFPVRRGEPDRNAIRSSLEALSQGKVLILFPEGTRSTDGQLQPGEPGVALIVQKSSAPVIPCAVFGSDRMMPPGQKGIRRAKLTVVFGRPIVFTEKTPREEILAGIMEGIAALIASHSDVVTIRSSCTAGVDFVPSQRTRNRDRALSPGHESYPGKHSQGEA